MRTAKTLIRLADAQADLSLCWAQMSFCWFSHAATVIKARDMVLSETSSTSFFSGCSSVK